MALGSRRIGKGHDSGCRALIGLANQECRTSDCSEDMGTGKRGQLFEPAYAEPGYDDQTSKLGAAKHNGVFVCGFGNERGAHNCALAGDGFHDCATPASLTRADAPGGKLEQVVPSIHVAPPQSVEFDSSRSVITRFTLSLHEGERYLC
jgi:hypothetical protein